ncbi:MAG: GIY-YIG nuclease family protein [Pseudomonadota bacterium]
MDTKIQLPNGKKQMRNQFYTYIVTNKRHGTLYIGVTNNIERRAWEHKLGLGSKFTRKYKLRRLVWFEEFPTVFAAIETEKRLKNWHRQWKINLIERSNPEWHDLLLISFGRDPETSSG